MGYGQKLRNILNEKNLTVAELSRISGIKPTTLYTIIDNDKDDIKVSVVKKIADAIKISPFDILWDEPATSMTELQSRYEKLGYDTTGKKADEAGRLIGRFELTGTLETSDESFNFIKDYLELDGNSQVDIERIVAAYISMGDIGRKKMVEYSQDLAKIQEYQNK